MPAVGRYPVLGESLSPLLAAQAEKECVDLCGISLMKEKGIDGLVWPVSRRLVDFRAESEISA
jgi:hypothetical protein